MLSVSTIPMTARQYLQLGEDPPGVRLELVNGEVAVSPSGTRKHSHAILRLARLIGDFVDDNALGDLFIDLDTVIDDYNVRRPDILFFPKKPRNAVKVESKEELPNLAVEVISPSSIKIDRADKFKQYCDAGIPYYWIVDTRSKTIEGWKLDAGQYVKTGEGRDDDIVHLAPFEALAIPLSRLWLE